MKFNYVLGGNKQQKNSKSSLTLPVTKTKERTSSGPFPTKGKYNFFSNTLKKSLYLCI